MIVRAVTAAPPQDLAAALARFEEQFTYPLGPGRSFRISHGDDYPRFFRAVGDAACFVAERDGEILGVLGLAVVPLRTPERMRTALYLGDLKVAPAARSGTVLHRLASASREWWSRADCAFAVVMDGTRVTPDAYTGRLGIPAFREVAKVAILRLSATADDPARVAAWRAGSAAGPAVFADLAAGHVRTDGGNPAERSEVPAAWLVAPDGSACGRLEDTRRAKRLITDTGVEMVSAHLACVGYRGPADLAELLRVARAAAGTAGFPAVFAAVPPDHATLGGADAVAPATVFATGIEPGPLWAVNTAEV